MKRITTLRFGDWRTWKICFKENKALRSSRPDELSSFSVWGEKETILVNSCKCECWWVAMASWPVPVIGKTCDGLVPCPCDNGQWTNIDKWQTVISKQLARRRWGRSADNGNWVITGAREQRCIVQHQLSLPNRRQLLAPEHWKQLWK